MTFLRTERTRLRPPAEGDRDLWVRLHTDPAQYPLAPWARAADPQAAGATFERALAHWAEHGFGYGVVEDATGEALGVAGVIHGREREHLNLYYRFDLAHHGRGLGTEVARALVADVVEHRPVLPLVATARPGHDASIRTAQRAGLRLVGAAAAGVELPGVPPPAVARARAADPDDVAPPVVLLAPRAETHRGRLGADAREGLLDLWCATNDAGGAVGFPPGAPREAVAEALAAHESALAAGRATAVLLRGPAGEVLACGFWGAETGPLLTHFRTGYRVMSDPGSRGRNLGRLVLAALHRAAREDGVEVVAVVARSGLGLSRFYERNGYVEVGRVPGNIRVAPGDDRDSIQLARRLDDRPMVGDGRP
ncbi:GNAT family N-acetyltransferase [Phycicoccus flavus]|uniref:GNAT family N-acetyltransferase n=1 Tax=Phycicoccus flavus TaxID=2502783 RepID=UPI000FEBF2F1|nr:GNAT family N-acetyltransferase [Phycicoccus flavus]NHA67828.1 GNAT family N-acetyltransferase [Phycicoccus flavus]